MSRPVIVILDNETGSVICEGLLEGVEWNYPEDEYDHVPEAVLKHISHEPLKAVVKVSRLGESPKVK